MTTIYHVAPTNHSGDLESLYEQHGEEAYEIYAERWPEAGDLAQYHVHYIHCYATLEEAEAHIEDGKIYSINTEDLDVEIDTLEFPHPMVRDEIPAACISEVANA